MEVELQASLLQSSVSHDSSEIIHADLLLRRHFVLLLSILKCIYLFYVWESCYTVYCIKLLKCDSKYIFKYE